MTTYVDADTAIVNRALQTFGTRTTVTTAEMNALSTNEAIQSNLIFGKYRDQLLRMAPWNCGVAYKNLVYLTSQPGTPENTSAYTSLWTPGQPPLGWAYEYLYPDDCLRACQIIPAMLTGTQGGIPIYPVPTSLGSPPTGWGGTAVRFKVQIDQYLRAASGSVTVVSGGTGHVTGDVLICGGAPSTQGEVPAGLINVSVTAAAGVITAASLTAFTNLNRTSLLYAVPTYNLSQVSTTGLGVSASLSVAAIAATASPARVILTNQEYATLAYVKQVTDSNVMDEDFVEAWANILGAGLVMALAGDKTQANFNIGIANKKIEDARKADGNEGLTVNDVTPDFIRIRGIDFAGYGNCWNGFDWGEMWPSI